MNPKEEKQAATSTSPTSTTNGSQQARQLSCTKCFDALWFCYSPYHQMQQYYRYGDFDTCFSKWNALLDCFSLKTKRLSEVQDRHRKCIGMHMLPPPTILHAIPSGQSRSTRKEKRSRTK
ncbi:uncharacterized protein LOC121989268 isoform X2 [Zingiber officinale]|uniref:uncharacterized protein LOC121989268 isoform X2 n=1 Tax=Zingiber officinale TaxID=94328 RepID=UPI001C4C0910|nr:uncharacterized protein LOC121989268 isoform X2 [Zingiber officinale]